MYKKSGRVWRPGESGFAVVQNKRGWAQTDTPNSKLEKAPFELIEVSGEKTPPPDSGTKLDKGDIAKKLKALNIPFDGRKSAEELAELLPKE